MLDACAREDKGDQLSILIFVLLKAGDKLASAATSLLRKLMDVAWPTTMPRSDEATTTPGKR
jgi:hypothetical protein